MRGVLVALCLILATPAAAAERTAGGTARMAESGKAKVDKFAPPFGGWSLDGQVVGLKGLLAPRTGEKPAAVLVSFFATWCAPCKAGLPHLQAVAQRYWDHGLVTLLVASGQEGGQVQHFLEEIGVRLPCIADKFGSISAKYGVVVAGESTAESSLPRTFLLDRLGRVRAIYGSEGRDFEEVVAGDLQSLLATTTSTTP